MRWRENSGVARGGRCARWTRGCDAETHEDDLGRGHGRARLMDTSALFFCTQITHADDDGARCRLGGIDSIVEKYMCVFVRARRAVAIAKGEARGRCDLVGESLSKSR